MTLAMIIAITVGDVNTDKIITSDNFPCLKKRFKYFFGYKNNKKNTPLCVF